MSQPITDAAPPDPFAHHPELRGKIADPATSFFRTFNVDGMIARFPQLEAHRSWTYSDVVREAMRARFLGDHDGGDLWVFGYGSLMWDPGFRFSDVRRANVPGFARQFILKDEKGGRGTAEAPGLMAALDTGPGCEGLAFRIAAADIDIETEILWRREMIGPGYLAAFVTAHVGGQPVTALTFVADHDADVIVPGLSRADQVRFIATGAGFLGTSKGYLDNIVSHFALLGIVDQHCESLLQEVTAYQQAA